MNISDTRVKSLPLGGLVLVCGDCGRERTLVPSDLQWQTLAFVMNAAEHDCEPVPARAPVTPRPSRERFGASQVRAFMADALTLAPGDVELLDDLYPAYREWHRGLSSDMPKLDRERFSGALKSVLPAGTAMRREMINGVRARRLIGMRLR